MQIKRRDLLTGLGGLAAVTALAPKGHPSTLANFSLGAEKGLPRKSDFAIPAGLTYINGAYTHPMPVNAAEAVRRNAEERSRPGRINDPGHDALAKQVKEQFAQLINARPAEISFVPNTSTGENLVFNSLGIIGSGGNVVTDALHFDGMILHLQALQKDQGLDLRIAMPKDGRIELRDLERLVDKKTKLVELSLVAMYNGFQHDLKAVCDLAHANGAYVYADIIQAAGATPIDVRATGVDFCSCSSFKWLMGDFGLGFLYAREDLLEKIRRPLYGYHSASRMDTHFLPFDPPAKTPFTWELGTDASAHFEAGSNGYGPMAALGFSLPYIRELGVEAIEAHRQPLLQRLRKEMPRLGFDAVTPEGTKSALITFSVKERQPVLERLQKANINVRLGAHFLRVSPSVYNDMQDIERLLEAIS
ncbi:MAG TPA: aminotransferase class V-fold PLP-dependent enzyme [Pyrinomonadaceae bacterium]|nr:aminotransferase class V-fold PLP-dependent enzyme [Pyrinomonadaceae bacterium]